MKYEKDKEVKSQKHDEHCWLWVIPFDNRTINSCNCKSQPEYKKQFENNRKQSKQVNNG